MPAAAYLRGMARPVIAVFSRHRHPRLRYVLNEVGQRLGGHFKLFTDQNKYHACECIARIQYASETERAGASESEIFIFAHSFLAGKEVSATDLTTGWGSDGFRFRLQCSKGNQGSSNPASSCFRGEQPAFFPSPNKRRYDPFSIIFFCLSRYEEYQPFTVDEHGRFPAKESHALKNNYLHFPLVDYLLAELAMLLKLTNVNQEAFFQATYDVDVPFAYRQRGIRGIGSGIKDLLTGHFRRGVSRFQTLLFGKNDPYDTFDQIRKLHAGKQPKPRVFFLLADKRSAYDPNPSPNDSAYQQLIRQTSEWAKIGIHPSYYSSGRAELVQREKDTLRNITNLPVTHSRQHFLRINLPGTYRELIRAGIIHDHSMGYASEIGWRAGTNQSFYWYDLEREQRTHLLVHPFGAMEVTLLRYKNLATLKSKEKLSQLLENLSPLGGPCTLLWHNSSFAADYGWEGWWEMYVELFT